MGFWDWLRPKSTRVVEIDRIWLSKTAKLAGLAVEVSALRGPVLVLAHFPSTLREVQESFTAVGVHGTAIEGRIAPAVLHARGGPPQILLARVDQLDLVSPAQTDGHDSPPIFVAERHFLRAHDEKIIAFANELGVPTTVCYFLSLDEPLMHMFAGDWVSHTLRQLGQRESEAIESRMVARKIRAAQDKLATRCTGDEPAESPGEWLQRNDATSGH